MTMKISLKQRDEETLKGTRLEHDPILFLWVFKALLGTGVEESSLTDVQDVQYEHTVSKSPRMSTGQLL